MKEYKFRINGREYNVTVDSAEGDVADVTVNGTEFKVEVENGQNGAAEAVAPSVSAPAAASRPEAAKPAGSASAKPVTSPLPGVIVEISVKEGDTVSAGQKVAVLEAMKMENEIAADRAGVIASVCVAKGDSVLEGAPIVTIA